MKFTLPANTPVKPFNKHWQFCVGSGHAGLALRTDYVAQLKFIHDELGIERVRFHGIFHDDMHTYHRMADIMPIPGTEGFVEKSFHHCGLVFDNLLACGMKPFVELGFMPEHMARTDARSPFFYHPSISMPKDDAEWEEYIRSFIRFLFRRYGEEEVRSWYFEVWNEPDLVPFFDGSQADYYHLYDITARAIKSVDEQLMVGGPATSGSKWVASFVRFCKEKNVPLDFVTTHQYAGDPLGGVEDDGGPDDEEMAMAAAGITKKDDKPKFDPRKLFAGSPFEGMTGSILEGMRMVMGDRSETTDLPNDVFKKNSAVVKQQAQGLPLFYTEWNENAGFSSYTNDTRKVAAYDAKAALDVEDNLTGSSVWCFSDLFEEFHIFPEEFHGGFGMQTLHGIPKPVFYAFKMLTEAGSERFVLPGAMDGEISMAGFKSEEGVQIMLIRQKMKNLDLPAETAEVEIELDAAPKAVILQRIDEEHCNPLKVWEEMGKPIDLTPAEIKSITEQTKMVDEPIDYTYENGVLSFKADLKVNDVYFVRIVK